MSAEKQLTRKIGIWWIAVLLTGIVIAALYLVRRYKKSTRHEKKNLERFLEDQGTSSRLVGLTSDEAASQQGEFDLDSEIRKEDRLFLRAAIRQGLFSTYNIDLFGIALILYLLGNPLAAIGTLLLVALNLILNVFQQMYTRKKLNQILKELRPQAVVLRDGELVSIEPALIVEGDYLVVRTGDEILVDGEIVRGSNVLVEEISSSGEAQQYSRQYGDRVSAGSYCLEGYTVYKSSEAGLHRYKAGPASRLQLLLGELTPLQRFMEWVFRILFCFVILIGVLLIADSLITGAELVGTAYQDAFSILFGIAPTSLFFILIISYAVGTLRISDRGALVYEARSIENLADASVLCISEESLVSGLQVDLEPIEPPEGIEPLSENLVHRILGDFVNSSPELDQVDQMLAEAIPGQEHPSIEIAPFLSRYGWQAASFDEPDIRGTLVLGSPEALAENLLQNQVALFEESKPILSRTWTNIGRRLRRSGQKQISAGEIQSETDSAFSTTDSSRLGWHADHKEQSGMEKLIDRIDQLLSPMEDKEFFKLKAVDQEPDIHLIFAYLPEPVQLYDRRGVPLLPENLIPLSHVGISAIIRAEGGQTIRDLVDAGLHAKILSADSPEEAQKTALDLGLPVDRLALVSGNDLEDLDESSFTSVLQEGNVLGDLTPALKAYIVEVLQQVGENVLMVGNSVHDLPAMGVANLKIALRNSARAAMKLTDFVLLKDSLAALPHVITTGQRLVNGILDIFKLYLSQTIAQMLLVLSILVFGLSRFPYHPTQAGIVSLFTVALPGIFLSVWAGAGRVTGPGMRRQLTHFIIPTAITLALLTWGVWLFFLSRYQNEEYAQLAVTYALLAAGWLRVLFVQPPTKFWVGGAPLRGDRRVVRVVIGAIVLFLVIISMPFFQEIMRITWMRSLQDYLLVFLAVVVWAFTTRTIWRSKWLESIINKI